jgi:protein-S-isoprenylcysteine O-methyltransferase Ste14
MFYFLLPLFIGFAFNWASAFTHFYSLRWGQRAGQLASFVLRNILGIPVWVYGLALAARSSATPFFNASLVTQVLGWLLLVAGTIPMIWGLHSLGLRSFRPTWRDTLVSSGIFRHIRHPIYSGLLIDFVALILLRPTKPALVACVLGWVYVYVQARLEEIDLLQRISGYREYMLRVPRFFPRFWRTNK